MFEIEELLKKHGGIRLDIGGGASPQKGFVNIDRRPLPQVDIVHDLNIHPWPLPDDCALLAIASHLVEHIPPVAMSYIITDEGVKERTWFPFMAFMDEAWRVLRPEAQFAIAMPYGASGGFYQDPTHCNPCNEATWAYFDPLEPHTGGALYRIYRPKPWKIESLSWNPSANMEVVMSKRRPDRSYDE